MKNHLKPLGCLSTLLLGFHLGTAQAQVNFLTAGAVSTNTGTKLKFVNGTNYASSSGFVLPMNYQRFSNRYFTNYFYGTTNLWLQALSARTNSDVSAALGSYIACEIVSVDGPEGGALTFWEQGAKFPTYQYAVGATYEPGKNRILLSNIQTGAGLPGGDPFGSIRGRRFTVNKRGEYLVTLVLHDTSSNHPELIAPIHAASDPLTIKLVADVNLALTSVAAGEDVLALSFARMGITNLFVEATTNLANGWTPVAGPFTNSPEVTALTFTNQPGMPASFYRLRGVAP
ncbi:MAG TPA: hypothetical protein VEH04_04195 [Verrucomicrobiae bacterium]|nr:hypothetical protein [Verrucomicrobiae bacterium]